MKSVAFEGIGTAWHLTLDTPRSVEKVVESVQQHIEAFDQQLSRFKNSSEVWHIYQTGAGTHTVTQDLALLLHTAKKLEHWTNGHFNAAIGTALQESGYDSQYQFHLAPEKLEQPIPQWEIHGTVVTTNAPTLFDVGGIGKGLLIDRVSQLLKHNDIPHHLVDAGGDMYGTHKANGSAWQVAIEWPGKPDMALGTVALKNAGFAASDIFRRRWKHWNHLLSAQSQESIQEILGSIAIAPSAFLADQATSILSFHSGVLPPEAQSEVPAEYVVMQANQNLSVSTHWPGTFF